MTMTLKKPTPILNNTQKELIREHIYLVKIIASKMAIFLPRHIDTDDLIHEGIMGLLDAAVKYDCKHGMKFSSYASIRIKGSILDSLRGMDWIPRRIRRLSKKIDKVREELQQEFRRDPTPGEISGHLGISKDKLYRIMKDVEHSKLLSFEELQLFSSRYYIPEDHVTSVTRKTKCTDFEKVDLRDQLKKALQQLSDKERLVLALYYLEDLTLKEIKLIMNISEARISQIHTKAIKKLRTMVNNEYNKTDKERACL
ncbi:MAG: FliA/WhiG family RNA polymerase sigma factor [Candidatus Eremiobacteraeota bacterium]|nr:FliA/WhiG family RNA polymerase sigma factor [Candidatus Eremiobacteraeota bacterium]